MEELINRFSQRLTSLPYLLLMSAPLFWAGNVVLARGINELLPPVAFAFWRWVTATAVILPFAWPYVQQEWPTVRRSWRILLLLGILGISSFNTLLYIGVQTTTAINAAMMQTVMPAMIVVFSLLLFREHITPGQLVSVLISIVGALVIVFRGDVAAVRSLSFVVGDGLIFVAVALYGLYSALLRKRPLLHPLTFIAVTFFMGTVGLLPIYLWELAQVGGFPLSRTIISSILYVAIFPSILSYLCWNGGISVVGANRGGLFINLVPVFASLLSILFLDELPQLFHLAGMVLIFGGMLLFHRFEAKSV
ncbi:MAG: DMT family transporter [Anaerolineales bacterium]|nr:DMT family transporter [Anaerolineales bacterium]